MQVDNELIKTRLTFRSVFFGSGNGRYNAGKNHFAHFRCKRCDTVYFLPIKESEIPKFRGNTELTITETQVYFLGTCKKCNKQWVCET